MEKFADFINCFVFFFFLLQMSHLAPGFSFFSEDPGRGNVWSVILYLKAMLFHQCPCKIPPNLFHKFGV